MKPKNFFWFLLATFFLAIAILPAYSAVPFVTSVHASQISNPAPSKEASKLAQMKWFVGLSINQYEKLRGKKMNFLEKFSFRASQNRMKKMVQHYDYGEVNVWQKISWLTKGILLGPIAVALVYIFA